MKCEICDDESPFSVIRIPFQCSCFKEKGKYSTLSKDLWEDGEYPETLKKFYEVFNKEPPKGE